MSCIINPDEFDVDELYFTVSNSKNGKNNIIFISYDYKSGGKSALYIRSDAITITKDLQEISLKNNKKILNIFNKIDNFINSGDVLKKINNPELFKKIISGKKYNKILNEDKINLQINKDNFKIIKKTDDNKCEILDNNINLEIGTEVNFIFEIGKINVNENDYNVKIGCSCVLVTYLMKPDLIYNDFKDKNQYYSTLDTFNIKNLTSGDIEEVNNMKLYKKTEMLYSYEEKENIIKSKAHVITDRMRGDISKCKMSKNLYVSLNIEDDIKLEHFINDIDKYMIDKLKDNKKIKCVSLVKETDFYFNGETCRIINLKIKMTEDNSDILVNLYVIEDNILIKKEIKKIEDLKKYLGSQYSTKFMIDVSHAFISDMMNTCNTILYCDTIYATPKNLLPEIDLFFDSDNE